MELIYPEFLRFKDRVAAALCRISWDVILIQGFRLDGHVYNARWGSIPLHLTFNMPEYRESANPPHCKCGVHDTAGAAPASGTICRCSTEVVQSLGKRKITGPNPVFGSSWSTLHIKRML